MTNHVCRRVALAVLGAVLALVATLSPLTASASAGASTTGGDGHSTTARPHPAVAARPASFGGAAPALHRIVGFAANPLGAAAMPVPLLTLLIGLLLAAGPPWRSRPGFGRRRPRGPPATAPALV